MINNLHINGIHTEITEDTRQYVQKKIGGLQKFIPASARESSRLEVKLKEANSSNKLCFECDVIIRLPHSTVVTHESSRSLIAAIDQAEANLKNQLKRYKNQHHSIHFKRRLMARFKGDIQPA